MQKERRHHIIRMVLFISFFVLTLLCSLIGNISVAGEAGKINVYHLGPFKYGFSTATMVVLLLILRI